MFTQGLTFSATNRSILEAGDTVISLGHRFISRLKEVLQSLKIILLFALTSVVVMFVALALFCAFTLYERARILLVGEDLFKEHSKIANYYWDWDPYY